MLFFDTVAQCGSHCLTWTRSMTIDPATRMGTAFRRGLSLLIVPQELYIERSTSTIKPKDAVTVQHVAKAVALAVLLQTPCTTATSNSTAVTVKPIDTVRDGIQNTLKSSEATRVETPHNSTDGFAGLPSKPFL